MKRWKIFGAVLGVGVLVLVEGCVKYEGSGGQEGSGLIEEGVIYSVQWTDQRGKNHGLTRASELIMIPGGDGSRNMDLYGRLFTTHLEMTNKQLTPPLVEIIPFERIDCVKFGDGGITFPAADKK